MHIKKTSHEKIKNRTAKNWKAKDNNKYLYIVRDSSPSKLFTHVNKDCVYFWILFLYLALEGLEDFIKLRIIAH